MLLERRGVSKISEGVVCSVVGRGRGGVEGLSVPPIAGSLFSWKSLLTKRRTSDDCVGVFSSQSSVQPEYSG